MIQNKRRDTTEQETNPKPQRWFKTSKEELLVNSLSSRSFKSEWLWGRWPYYLLW